MGGDYWTLGAVDGVVGAAGALPEFSCDSRAALSPDSWVAFSLPPGVKLPPPGRWPEFSAASRAALSPASWVAFSLDLKVPALGAADAAAKAEGKTKK